MSAPGCDSIQHELSLTVDYRIEDYVSKCLGESVTFWVDLFDDWFFEDTLSNLRGCDSITWSVDLTVNTPLWSYP